MKVSVNLLKQFGNIDADEKEIVRLVKEHIGEVESHHNLKEEYKDIVIAQIEQKEDHPDADKLGVYQIKYGPEQNIQVVAGDQSLKVGDKVAYLKVGSTVPSSIYTEPKPFKISPVKLRGVESNGMLGSAKELNIGNDHTHVMVLPKDAPVGESFAEYFQLNDTVLEIENKALTNRGDLFSILGISRELTAITGNKFETPRWYFDTQKNLKEENTCLHFKITNDAEALCPRYTAIALDNISIEESPIWLKSTLLKCGIKPINNIVDVTNYISLLIGQPLHAFDFDKLIKSDPNSQDCAYINIRMAKQGEKIVGLDDKTYELNENNIVIADSTHPIAIAGIIGGKDTEVDENTTRIILESANFDKTSVRKSSMQLGINTEAGTRFKHQLSTDQCLAALKKTVEVIKDITEAKTASSITDIYEPPYKLETVSISVDILNQRLGTDLDIKEVKRMLENLEYEVKNKKKDTLHITPPEWRKDIDIAEDIYEDVGRIYGYNNIELQLPQKQITPPHKNKIFETKKLIRNILSNNGANETLTYSFTSLDSFKNSNLDPELSYKLKNPLSPELSLMRTTILQSLLQKAKENVARGFDKLAIYEMNIAHINTEIEENLLPLENWYLSLLLTSNTKDINGSAYFSAKAYVQKVLNAMHIYNVEYKLIADVSESDMPSFVKNLSNMFDPNTSAVILVEGIMLGVVGELLNTVKDKFKLPPYTSGFELDINQLSEIKEGFKKYKEQPVYPAFSQDLCFESSVEIEYKEMESTISKVLSKNNLWYKIEGLDIYQNSKKEDVKKTTFRVTASSYDKTLTETEIKDIIGQIEKTIDAKLV